MSSIATKVLQWLEVISPQVSQPPPGNAANIFPIITIYLYLI